MLINQINTKQFHITIPAGKRLIAKAVLSLEQVKKALDDNTIVIIAGTTNAYIAEELLSFINQSDDFSKSSFFRGVTTAPGRTVKPKNDGHNNNDIVIEKGKWMKDKTIFDVADSLGIGDIIFKGANAVDSERKQAGILIGNPSLGTSGPILQAAIGKRTELIIPVGLEKRVIGEIGPIATLLNDISTTGLRMLPICGTIITELEAMEILTGAAAQLVAAGGIYGAEGSYWIAASGTPEQLNVATELYNNIAKEPPFI